MENDIKRLEQERKKLEKYNRRPRILLAVSFLTLSVISTIVGLIFFYEYGDLWFYIPWFSMLIFLGIIFYDCFLRYAIQSKKIYTYKLHYQEKILPLLLPKEIMQEYDFANGVKKKELKDLFVLPHFDSVNSYMKTTGTYQGKKCMMSSIELNEEEFSWEKSRSEYGSDDTVVKKGEGLLFCFASENTDFCLFPKSAKRAILLEQEGMKQTPTLNDQLEEKYTLYTFDGIKPYWLTPKIIDKILMIYERFGKCFIAHQNNHIYIYFVQEDAVVPVTESINELYFQIFREKITMICDLGVEIG